MSDLSAIPQNQLGGFLAQALRGGKDVLNWPGKLPESVPLVGGMGAGDLVFGKSLELVEDMSYGFPPYKGSGMATKVDPRTVDLALAPGVGTAAGMALRGGAAIPKAAVQMATNEGRREFMKKAAGLAAGGAVTAATPDMLMQALKKAPAALADAAPLVAKEVAPAAVAQVVRAWTPEMIKSGLSKAAETFVGDAALQHTPKLEKMFLKKFKTPDEMDNFMAVYDIHPNDFYKGLTVEETRARNTILEKMDEELSYDKLERALKQGKVPKTWEKKGYTMSHVKEKMKDFLDDPDGVVDFERPDLISELFRSYYGD